MYQPIINYLAIHDNTNSGVIVMLISGSLPLYQFINLDLGLMYLNPNKTYYARIEIEYKGSLIVKDQPQIINLKKNIPNNVIVDNLIGATFSVKTPIINLAEGDYKINVYLLDEQKKQLDKKSIHFYAQNNKD